MADKVFTMRIDEDLLEKIRISADANKRSLAKEIEFTLSNWYNPDERRGYILPPELTKLVIDEVNRQFAEKNKN